MTAASLRVLLVIASTALLAHSCSAIQAKVDLYRKNRILDKNQARSSRNVLCKYHGPPQPRNPVCRYMLDQLAFLLAAVC